MEAFYRKVRPAGPFWSHIARKVRAEGIEPEDKPKVMLTAWIAACVLVYAMLFATGKFLLGAPGQGAIFLVIGIACAIVLIRTNAFGPSKSESS